MRANVQVDTFEQLDRATTDYARAETDTVSVCACQSGLDNVGLDAALVVVLEYLHDQTVVDSGSSWWIVVLLGASGCPVYRGTLALRLLSWLLLVRWFASRVYVIQTCSNLPTCPEPGWR
jgi:hypothetical protein